MQNPAKRPDTQGHSRDDERELNALYQRILKSPFFPSLASSRADLFTYLWEHRHEKSYGPDIWVKALRHTNEPYVPPVAEKPEKSEKPRTPNRLERRLTPREGRPVEYSNPPDNVRERCKAVSDALHNFFEGKQSGWIIELPEGGPTKGYQLKCERRSDPNSATRAFWHPHLDSGRPISVLFIEQLFFHDAKNNIVFRYYDCNEEHSPEALRELNRLHGDSYPEQSNVGLKPIYPYVAWGEARAASLISGWFAEYAFEKVEQLLTRRLYRDHPTIGNSLILFGSAPGNRFITKVLDSHEDLQITLESRSRVRINTLTDEEQQRLSQMETHRLIRTDAGYILEFYPKFGPAILTRVANLHSAAGRTPVTIFNSDFGTAVEALARILTNEDRLKEALHFLTIKQPLPAFFQYLCAVSLRSESPGTHPLLWRPYAPAGI